MEALGKYTFKVLNDSQNSITLLNTNVTQMHKPILQGRMALDVLTAAQGGTCAIIKAECCIYIPDYNKALSGLLTYINNQITALKHPTLSFNNWLSSCLGGGLWSLLKSPQSHF